MIARIGGVLCGITLVYMSATTGFLTFRLHHRSILFVVENWLVDTTDKFHRGLVDLKLTFVLPLRVAAAATAAAPPILVPRVSKAEEIRSRRDHNAWLSRVASGLDIPIQDPISLLGECMEGRRHLQEETDKGLQQLSRGNHIGVPPAGAHFPGDRR